MRKLYIVAILLAGALVVWGVRAQQTPSSGTSTALKSSTAKSATSTSKTTTAENPLTTDKEKQSYAMGMNIGEQLQKQSIILDFPLLERGLKDVLTGGKPLLTDADMKAQLTQLQKEEIQILADKESKEGQAYLAQNKTKEGVVVLPDGLQYKILTAGTGPKPKATDNVVCNYRGMFTNGQEFDDSYKRGQPITFAVDHIIKGWTEALQLMPVGSKWQLVIPPDLAYGAAGKAPIIPPNATLIFEVELLSIKPTFENVPPNGAQPKQ